VTAPAKSSADFATDVDIAAEQAVTRVVRDARAGDAIRGEELGVSGHRDAPRVWLVDALCGTLNFASHTPAFSVSVALVSDEQVLAAAVADPLSGEVFWTDGIRAAWPTPTRTPPSSAPCSWPMRDRLPPAQPANVTSCVLVTAAVRPGAAWNCQ
jgi:myo-inositol-1(or 4)-monophosphatase